MDSARYLDVISENIFSQYLSVTDQVSFRLQISNSHWNSKWCSLLVWLANSKLQMIFSQSELTILIKPFL